MKIIPIILSGGSGTRLWPLSRAAYPKQFLGVTAETSLFNMTLERLAEFGDFLERPIVICNENHRFIVAEQCRNANLQPFEIVLEPEGRNTAPAIAVAALVAKNIDPDPLLLILPADHALENLKAFREAVEIGSRLASEGLLVTFGVKPTSPETGYGYIECGATEQADWHTIRSFAEKPDLNTAKSYLANGNYYWNSGMFLFKATSILSELDSHHPALTRDARHSIECAQRDLDFFRLGREQFMGLPHISIDYAVMEHTTHGAVVPLNAGWSDVGAWNAVWQIADKDQSENATRGDVLMESTHCSYVHATSRLVATLGVEDLIVVETSDAVLVASKSHVQDVKLVVERLKELGRDEANIHREVFRPWGTYDSVDKGDRYQVKRITVTPGHRLSVQLHHHRAEHWIVVSGTAKVKVGEEDILLTENQSVYIPVGVKHSLENPGRIPLEIIEVQSGSYLGEDDILRFEDRYGRAE